MAVLLAVVAACVLAVLVARTQERLRNAGGDGSSRKSVHVQSEAELH
jgi:hypothetical protein